MCQTFEELVEKRAEIIGEETRIETLFNAVRGLMASMKWTAEQAMSAMNVSEVDQTILRAKF